MTKKHFLLSDDAREDLQDIKKYLLNEGGPPLVRHVFNRINSAMQMLATNPLAGHTRTDLTNEAVGFWPVFSHLIVYDSQTKPLGIARVIHGNQDLARIFQRKLSRL